MLVEVCPKCGSNKIQGRKTVKLYGQKIKVKCLNCDWEGTDDELLVHEMVDSGISNDAAIELTKEVFTQFTVLLSQNLAEPVVKTLVQSGLIARKDIKRLQKLATKAIVAVFNTVVQELKEEDKEEAEKAGVL